MFRAHHARTVLGALFVLTVWTLAPPRAAGWSAGGHRVVANIAYDRLDPAIRTGIVDVLRQHEDFKKNFADRMPDDIRTSDTQEQERWIFLQAAIWPDLIRSNPKYHKETWHFINRPFFLSAHDKAVMQDLIHPNLKTTLPQPLTTSAREHLNCIQAFKLCVRELTDADSTDPERAIAFCWLLHIGGDIHQPMHSTSLVSRGRFHQSEGDRGGNGIKIKQGKNLHSYWDGLLGNEQPLNDIKGRAADILKSDTIKQAAEKAAEQLSVEKWVQESHDLARKFAYHELILKEVADGEAEPQKKLHSVDLPEEYRKEAGRRAQLRVAQAGYRLAEILRDIEE
jgi:S1/P1 Nuclease